MQHVPCRVLQYSNTVGSNAMSPGCALTTLPFVACLRACGIFLSPSSLPSLDPPPPLSLSLARARAHAHVRVCLGVRLAIANGANPEGTDESVTPLMAACAAGSAAVVAHLLEQHSVDVNRSNAYGQTALIFAAQSGAVDVADYLLRNHASTIHFECLCAGRTAAQVARKSGHPRLADHIAVAASDQQVAMLVNLLADAERDTDRPYVFDSAKDRLHEIYSIVGAAPPEPDYGSSQNPLCRVHGQTCRMRSPPMLPRAGVYATVGP